MKKALTIIVFIALQTVANCQTKPNIQVQLGNYKQGDTINIDSFIAIDSLSVNLKNYKVDRFDMLLWDGIVKEFKSSSSAISSEIKEAVQSMKKRSIKTTKIYFDNIWITSHQGESHVTGGIIYILKIK